MSGTKARTFIICSLDIIYVQKNDRKSTYVWNIFVTDDTAETARGSAETHGLTISPSLTISYLDCADHVVCLFEPEFEA